MQMDHNTQVRLKPLFYHYNQISRMGWRKGWKKRPWHVAYPSASWSEATRSSTHLSPGQEPWGRSCSKGPSSEQRSLSHGNELSRVGPPGLGRTVVSLRVWGHLSLQVGGKAGPFPKPHSSVTVWVSNQSFSRKRELQRSCRLQQQGPSGWPCRSLLWPGHLDPLFMTPVCPESHSLY